MWNTDTRSAVSHSVAELIDGLRLVETRQAKVVVRTVGSDVLVAIFLELGHEPLKVFLTSGVTHELRRKVTVHSRTVPVALEWLTVILHVDSVFFANALEDVTCHPDLVASCSGTFSKNLEFPLAFGDLGG